MSLRISNVRCGTRSNLICNLRFQWLSLWHLQDLAPCRLIGLGDGFIAQEFSHQAQGCDFLLQAFQFRFLPAQYFDGILLHRSPRRLMPDENVRFEGGWENVT